MDFTDLEEKQYVHHKHTGQRGWIVEVDGEKKVRLDRPEEILIDFKSKGHEWMPIDHTLGFSRMQLSMVAYEADRQLCRLLGYYDKANRQWEHLTGNQRRLWSVEGPTTDVKRMNLYKAIMEALDVC